MSQRIDQVSTVLMAAMHMAGAGSGWNLKAPAFGGGAAVVQSDEEKVLAITKLLVGKVDLNAVDNEDRTAALGAMLAEYPSVVEFLVANGAKMPDKPPTPARRGRGGDD